MAWSKESRQSRGYGAEWTQVREVVIKRDMGLCQECKRNGIIKAGKDVDHKVSKAKAAQMGWREDQIENVANLEYLCKMHHDEKTARENGRTYRPKQQIGLDGWPIE